MIASALAFLAGIVLVQQFSALPSMMWLMVCGIGAGILAWSRYWYLLFFVLGILWVCVFAGFKLDNRLPESLAGVDVHVKGVVVGLPNLDERRVRFDFVVTESMAQLPDKLKLSWYNTDKVVKAGQHWSFTVKLKPPHGNLNPGGFDYERWLFTEGVGATGYVRIYPKPELVGQDSPWASPGIWRQKISDSLSTTLATNQQLGLIKALTIGDGSGITQQQWDVFRKTGTIHLVVISGTHIGLVAGLVYLLVLKLWAWLGYLKWSPQKVAAGSALIAGVFYASLAGFSVPAQRAVIMLAIGMLAIILQRHARPFNTLAAALFAVLIYDPLAVLAPGFWLSFLAVGIIVYVVAGRLGKANYFFDALKINWATSLGLSPLLLFFFQQVSLCSPLANFIAVPIISLLVVPGALVSVLLMLVSPSLAMPLFWLLDKVLQGLYGVLDWLAELPFATITHSQPPYWALFFVLPGMLLLLAPKGLPGQWLGLVMLMPIIFTRPNNPEPGNFILTLLDVGQGLAVVVQTSQHTLVYDTGAKFSADSDMGRGVVLPFLRARGVAKIDNLMISHGDNDHIGGTASLLQQMPADTVLTSVPQQLSQYAPVMCRAGQSWRWDEVSFAVLSPPLALAESDNDNSCVLKITAKNGSVLLTGDIEARAERALVETYGDQLKAKVLIAPHHGSKTSSTTAFLRAVQPRLVLIPAGYRSQFGHPHKKVLLRYQTMRAKWLNTADSGAITINSEGGLTVQIWREIARRYWHRY
ncbi:MAG: DNA internalization-related competence protein ComEC/Rec2 [Methylovulum sp.]|nr:DNA internalization-related competence protein ComEC/Rec2 [Methylovulum sp.]